MHTYANPVIPGFHPDPSVTRVGADYFLVRSSFTWFPALPVLHSVDLVHWETVGHVVTDADALVPAGIDLGSLDVSDGFWAPTIRHHAGTFYVVVAVARGRRGAATLLFTAEDARGPWSGPTRLDADGIDPSLFFDTDGTCWFHASRDSTVPGATGPGEIYVRRLDLATLTLTGPETVVWHGAVHGAWVEAPHLYRSGDGYLLLAAEGGTESMHSVVAARSSHPEGPWRTDPRSPLLTHRHLAPDEEIQNVGHADLVDDPDGRWWAVVLGVRKPGGHHTLGRETFLVPVGESEDGPVFAPGQGRVSSTVVVDGRDTGPVHPVPDPVPVTGAWFTTLRGPAVTTLSGPTGTAVDLRLSPTGLDALQGVPAFLGFAQRHLDFTADLDLDLTGVLPGDRAGVALFNTTDAFVAVALEPDGTGTAAITVTGPAVPPGATAPERRTDVRRPLTLTVVGDVTGYHVHCGSKEVAFVPRSALSTETSGGFLGVHLGPFGISAGGAGGVLRVCAFRYRPEVPLVPDVPRQTGELSVV